MSTVSSEKNTASTRFNILKPIGVSGLSEFQWQPPQNKKQTKKLTGQTEEKIGFDRSQPSFSGTY